MKNIGIDIGSTTVKLVVMEGEKILYHIYQRHLSQVRQATLQALEGAKQFLKGDKFRAAISGSAGLGLAEDAGIDFVQEVFACGEAVKKYESQIVNSKIKLSISSDTYLENIIDKIAGVYIDLSHEESHSFVLKDTLIQKYNLKTDGYSECLIAPMVDDEMLKDIISYTYNDNIDQSSYVLNNQVMPMLSSVNSVISTLENVFFYIGIGFAVFASIMFCNFIATSIANKKREIGILRAVGARGIDVLKIFLNESLMIAVINWILSVIACFAGVTLINQYIRNEFGVLVTILNFGLLQIVLLLMISIAVACIASAIPVYKISKKKPIDAIKDRK